MQTGILDEVAVGGGGDRGDIADVLHHGGDGNGRHDQNGGDIKLCKDELLQTDQVSLADGSKVDQRLHHAVCVRKLHAAGGGDERHDVAADHAEQDGDDLGHALAPDVCDHNDRHGDQREPPAGLRIGDGGAGEVETDHDDHGTGDDGREITHDLLDAEQLEQKSEHEVEKTGDHDAAECIGKLGLGVHALVSRKCCNRGEAAEIGKGGTEEGRYLELGAHMEQQRAETGHEERGLDAQRQTVALHKDGDKHCCAEHGEQMLQTQQQHAGHAQRACIIDGFVTQFFFHDRFPLSFVIIYKMYFAYTGQKENR